MPRAARPAVLAGAGCALLAVLGGCSSTVAGEAFPAVVAPAKPTVPPAGPGNADPAAAPLVGTCYTIAAGQEGEPLNPPDPVNCTQEHNAETAKVGDSGLGAEDPYPTADDVADADTPVGAAVADFCDLDVVRAYLGGDDLDDPFAFYAPYLPSEEQWAAGARWLRCDVYYGYAEPETAPGVMDGALLGPTPGAYRVCFVGTPTDYRVVPCSEPHDAEPVGTRLADVSEDAPYPDEATRSAAVDSCTDDVADYVGGPTPIGYAPDVWIDTAEEWADFPYARCVLVPAGGGRASGSVRG